MTDMNIDDVTRAARDAGAEVEPNGEIYTFSTREDLFFFAELIALQERKRVLMESKVAE